MTRVTLPSQITQIGEMVFADCFSLTEITIPDSVTEICNGTFSACRSLTQVTIPAGVTSIGDTAFRLCDRLTDIHFAGTVQQWNAISKGVDWNVYTGNYTVHCIDGDITK